MGRNLSFLQFGLEQHLALNTLNGQALEVAILFQRPLATNYLVPLVQGVACIASLLIHLFHPEILIWSYQPH